MLKNVLKNISFSLFLLLGGCVSTPHRVGLSSEEWANMSPAQRENIAAHYALYQRDRTLMGTVYDGPKLQVYLAEGTAKMPPDFKSYPFDTIAFFIEPGECKQIALESIDTGNHTQIEACYNGVTLLMDPSHYILNKRTGSIRFDYNPIWKRGFSFVNVNSSGYVSLRNTCLTIKAFAVPSIMKAGNKEYIAPKPMPTSRANSISNTEPVMPIHMTPKDRSHSLDTAENVEQIEKAQLLASEIVRPADMNPYHKAIDDTDFNLRHASHAVSNRLRHLPPTPPNVHRNVHRVAMNHHPVYPEYDYTRRH